MAIIKLKNSKVACNHILILIASFLLMGQSLMGQEKIRMFYNSDWEVTSEDKASYYREAEYDLNRFKLNGLVEDYTISGNLIMAGNYQNDKKNGKFIFYHKNGTINSEGKYENNTRVGEWKYYYETGELKQTVLFKGHFIVPDFVVCEYFDRAGRQLIANGSGKWENDSVYTGLFARNSLTRLTGQFKDSLKHGEWKQVRISDNKAMHTERFRNGKFVDANVFNIEFNYYGSLKSEMLNKFPDEHLNRLNTAVNFKLDTTVYPSELLQSDVKTIFLTITGKDITIQNMEAGYKHGDYSLLEFIARNIRYPQNAQIRNVSGRVYINVTIDEQGIAKDVAILRGVDKDLDNEALRVVKLVKDWMPAIRNGKPIESTITIPVLFNIK